MRRVRIRKSQINRSESGASLVELLATMGIIVSALVILITALSTGAFAVRVTDRLTTATNLATAQLETIKAAEYLTSTVGYAAIPAGDYGINQQISYWNGSSFTPAPGADSGMQWITVTVSYDSETLVTISNFKVKR